MSLPPMKDLQVLGPISVWGDAGDAYPQLVLDPTTGRVSAGSGASVATRALNLNSDGIALADSDELTFGNADDAVLSWDGALMRMGPGAGMWGNAPSPGMASYDSIASGLYEDFLDSTIAVATLWTVTETSSNATQTIETDTALGIMELDLVDSDDNDGTQISYIQEQFVLATGKDLWFEARVRFPDADVTDIDWFVGLAVTEDLIAVADNMPANGFGFRKDDDDLKIDAFSSDNGTNLETTNTATLVTNTWVKLGMYFDGGATGAATITPYIDGVAGTAIAAVTYATMSEVCPTFMVRNGDAVQGQVMDIDYVKVVQLR